MHEQAHRDAETVRHVPQPEPLEALKLNELNCEQRRAFDIVTQHLSATEGSTGSSQLLMQLIGEGGTGKSRVIQTITHAFEISERLCMLRKAAYTGIAACLIGGQTLHSL
ncbi:hypothetical protein M378DRAFT_75208, partial [Amanita muscaria Koide BX008]